MRVRVRVRVRVLVRVHARVRVRVRVQFSLAPASVKLMQSRSASPSITLLFFLSCSSIPRTLYPLRVVWIPLIRGPRQRRRLQTPNGVGVVGCRCRGETGVLWYMCEAEEHTPASTPLYIS